MKIGLALVIGLALTGAASADECKPMAEIRQFLADNGGGRLVTLSSEQFLFARGLYVGSPPPSGMPSGDKAALSTFSDGSGMVIFFEGDQFCDKMGLAPKVVKLLLDAAEPVKAEEPGVKM